MQAQAKWFWRAALVGIFVTACLLAAPIIEPTPQGIEVGPALAAAQMEDGAPLDFRLPTLHGAPVRLSQFRGHPVIVDFWATWCAPCRRQIPELEAVYARYHKSRGLVVLGVSCDALQGGDASVIAPFAHKFKMNYPILIGNEQVINALGIQAIPTTLFIRPDGRVVARVMGAGRTGELTADARALLNERPGHGNEMLKPDSNAVNL